MRRALPILPEQVEELGDTVLTRALEFIGDATFAPVSRRRALRRYREAGYDIAEIADIRALDAVVPDRLAQGLVRRWMVAAGSVGGAVGTLGAAGLVADVPALLAINLMAVGEYACTYGFDVAHEDERAFAIALLLADRQEDSRQAATVGDTVRELHEGAAQIRGSGSRRLETDTALTAWVRSAAWRLVRRLLQRKLGQLVPVVGAVIGASIDATFTRETCRIAREVYRQRFLDEPPASPHGL